MEHSLWACPTQSGWAFFYPLIDLVQLRWDCAEHTVEDLNRPIKHQISLGENEAKAFHSPNG